MVLATGSLADSGVPVRSFDRQVDAWSVIERPEPIDLRLFLLTNRHARFQPAKALVADGYDLGTTGFWTAP